MDSMFALKQTPCHSGSSSFSLWVPEEDVSGLTGGAGLYQLLLELLQGAVVDVDWTL